MDLANSLYRVTGEVVAYCLQHNIVVSVENPARSHFWATSFFRKPLEGLWHKLRSTFFHHCMHGSCRRKHTLLLHNCPAFEKLGIQCDGGHSHEPWGFNKTWATSQETAYPALLCQRYAAALAQHLSTLGFIGLPAELTSQIPLVNDPKLNQIAAGKQPRGKKIPPLVSEFASIVVISGPASCVHVQSKFASPWKVPNEVTCSDSSFRGMPSGARVLRSFIYGDDGRRSQEMITDNGIQCDKNNTNKREITVGIQWPPDEFVKLALNKQHPNAFVKPLPGVMINTLNKLVQSSTGDIARERTASARKWFLRAQELRDEESKFKDSLATHCSTILRNKRLLVFREMLSESGYGDVKLVENMSRGFDLMGDLPTSSAFAKSIHMPL